MTICTMEYIDRLVNPKINILGMNTNIILDKPSEHFLPPNAMGRWVATTNSIFINRDLCQEQQVATLYHEVTHALLEALGELDLSKNEDFVEKLSRGLLQTMKLRITCE